MIVSDGEEIILDEEIEDVALSFYLPIHPISVSEVWKFSPPLEYFPWSQEKQYRQLMQPNL